MSIFYKSSNNSNYSFSPKQVNFSNQNAPLPIAYQKDIPIAYPKDTLTQQQSQTDPRIQPNVPVNVSSINEENLYSQRLPTTYPSTRENVANEFSQPQSSDNRTLNTTSYSSQISSVFPSQFSDPGTSYDYSQSSSIISNPITVEANDFSLFNAPTSEITSAQAEYFVQPSSNNSPTNSINVIEYVMPELEKPWIYKGLFGSSEIPDSEPNAQIQSEGDTRVACDNSTEVSNASLHSTNFNSRYSILKGQINLTEEVSSDQVNFNL